MDQETVLQVYGKSAEDIYIRFMEDYVATIEPDSREAYAELFSLLDLISGQRVLEVGVGTGRNIHRYPSDVSLVGVDLTAQMLEIAKGKSLTLGRENMTFEACDASDLPFEDNSFDAVVSTYTLCVTEEPQRVLDEMFRVCRPGGRIGLYGCRKATMDPHILKSQEYLANTLSTVGLFFEGQAAVVYNVLSDLDEVVKESLQKNQGSREIVCRIMEHGPIECLGMYVLEK